MSFNVADIKQKSFEPKKTVPPGWTIPFLGAQLQNWALQSFSQTRGLRCVNNSESVVTSVNVRAGFHMSVESNQAITLVLVLLRFEIG